MTRLDTFTPEYMKTEVQSARTVEAAPLQPSLDFVGARQSTSPAVHLHVVSQAEKALLAAEEAVAADQKKKIRRKKKKIEDLKRALEQQERANRVKAGRKVGPRGALPLSLVPQTSSAPLSTLETDALSVETATVPASEFVAPEGTPVPSDEPVFITDEEESLFEKPMVKVAAVAAVAAAGYFLFTRMS